MTTISERARELLAAEYAERGFNSASAVIANNLTEQFTQYDQVALRAIETALSTAREQAIEEAAAEAERYLWSTDKTAQAMWKERWKEVGIHVSGTLQSAAHHLPAAIRAMKEGEA